MRMRRDYPHGNRNRYQRGCRCEPCRIAASEYRNAHPRNRYSSPDWRACSIEGCERPQRAREWCSKHWTRWRQTGDPTRVLIARSSSDAIGYAAMHHRLRREQGSARRHPCRLCGLPALHWAYDHLDPEEKVGSDAGRPAVFSTNIIHYFPACAPCHKRFDMAVTGSAS